MLNAYILHLVEYKHLQVNFMLGTLCCGYFSSALVVYCPPTSAVTTRLGAPSISALQLVTVLMIFKLRIDLLLNAFPPLCFVSLHWHS